MARIYTGTGDDGYTYCRLLGRRVPKSHPLISVMGTLDELNSFIGLARSLLPSEAKGHSETLREIQKQLFKVGYLLVGEKAELDVKWLEEVIDHAMQGMELKGFILPAGPPPAAALHVARTICRRLERELVRLWQLELDLELDPVITFVNRLSDTLFALAVRIARDLGWPEEYI